jgi:formate C-acetyltransferase
MRELSDRLQRLQQRFEERYRALGGRLYVEPEEAATVAAALERAWQETAGQPVIVRRARGLTEFAATAPLCLHPDDLLVGRQTFNPVWAAGGDWRERLTAVGYAATTGHIVHDYAALLQAGIGGLQEQVFAAAGRGQREDQALCAQAFLEALQAFADYLGRHALAAGELAESLRGASRAEWRRRAESLQRLTSQPPATFPEALQLLWLMQIFLHAENPSMAISFGRLDQYLWPFLQADLQEGRLTLDQAFEWVGAFCLKCCEGEESQNLVLGGLTESGERAENPLSVLLLEAVEALDVHQPSLTVRVGEGMAPEFLQAACRLAARGKGQPGFMNDPVVTHALQAAGIPPERARDWAVVGCYEAVPQGDAYANTVLGNLHLPALLTDYLGTPVATAALNFGSFFEGFCQHLREAWRAERQRLQAAWHSLRDRAPSPFGSLLLGGCVAQLTPLEAGGGRFNLIGVNLQGLGTAIDSLRAIAQVVYENHELSLGELAAAVQADFPDEALRSRLWSLPGRYGTDDPRSNALAQVLSAHLARLVLATKLPGDVQPYPGFFRFSGDIYDTRCATPDGRHQADPCSYGCGPCSGLSSSPTAVLRSAAGLAHDLCGCGNPLALTLPLSPGETSPDPELIAQLVTTYFALGGFHVHFNCLTAAQLREAQAHPDQWPGLQVRVSGFSARFVRLDERWQDVLIQRADRGL